MQRFKLLFLCFIGGIMLAGCDNKPAANSEATSTVDTTTFATVIRRFKNSFSDGNQLFAIPLRPVDYSDGPVGKSKTDSLAFVLLVQDSTKTYYAGEGPYEGTFLHAVVDTYANFTLVCLEHNMGDVGDVYTLNTYTKSGIKIAGILAAEMPGEESEYAFYLNSVLRNDTLIRYETHCRYDPICDSFTRYSLLNHNGLFVELKTDSVLDSRLDTIRKTIFNY